MIGKTIQESLDLVNEQIANYVPQTKWEESNGRTLKLLHKRRVALEYALERARKKTQEILTRSFPLLDSQRMDPPAEWLADKTFSERSNEEEKEGRD
jgi:hypothetical protein